MTDWQSAWPEMTDEQAEALRIIESKYRDDPEHMTVEGVIADTLIAMEHPDVWLKDK